MTKPKGSGSHQVILRRCSRATSVLQTKNDGVSQLQSKGKKLSIRRSGPEDTKPHDGLRRKTSLPSEGPYKVTELFIEVHTISETWKDICSKDRGIYAKDHGIYATYVSFKRN